MNEYPSPFLDPGKLIDGDLELVLRELCPDQPCDLGPAYQFDMVHAHSRLLMGDISLRIAVDEHKLAWAGHVDFEVLPQHRGHRYAAGACRLLLPLAARHGLDPLWITADPDNLASRKTCEIIGARLIEIVDLPSDCPLRAAGRRKVCRYRLDHP